MKDGVTVRTLLQPLADCLWPVRDKVNASGVDPDVYLRPLVVLLIVLACGPEVFVAADLVWLVDFLGAVVFLTVFAMEYRALCFAALTRVHRVLLPPEWTVLVRVRRHPSIAAHGLMLIGMNALHVSLLSLVALVGVLEVARQVA
jgi:hypothetical protein